MAGGEAVNATPKTFLAMCRRMWAARDLRDSLMMKSDAVAYLKARHRADKLERIVLSLVLP